MFAPDWLFTSEIPARSRIPASIAAVVVLPFVADTSTLPRDRRAPSSPIAPGSRRISTFPGALDAPPPRRRETAPTARARASFGASGPAIRRLPEACSTRRPVRARRLPRPRRLPPRRSPRPMGSRGSNRGRGKGGACRGDVRGHEHRDRAADRAHAHGQLADRIAVGVHREGTVAGDLDRGGAKHVHGGQLDVGALEDPRQELRQELALADVLEHDDLEQAVVEHRVRRRAHPAAVGLRVAAPTV